MLLNNVPKIGNRLPAIPQTLFGMWTSGCSYWSQPIESLFDSQFQVAPLTSGLFQKLPKLSEHAPRIISGEPGSGKTKGILYWLKEHEYTKSDPSTPVFVIYRTYSRIDRNTHLINTKELAQFIEVFREGCPLARICYAGNDYKKLKRISRLWDSRGPNGKSTRGLLGPLQGMQFLFVFDLNCPPGTIEVAISQAERLIEEAEEASCDLAVLLLTREYVFLQDKKVSNAPGSTISSSTTDRFVWDVQIAPFANSRDLPDEELLFGLHGGNLGIRDILVHIRQANKTKWKWLELMPSRFSTWVTKQIYEAFVKCVNTNSSPHYVRSIAERRYSGKFQSDELTALSQLAGNKQLSCPEGICDNLIERGIIYADPRIRSRIIEIYLRLKEPVYSVTAPSVGKKELPTMPDFPSGEESRYDITMLKFNDQNRLAEILVRAARTPGLVPQEYFRGLVNRADLPPEWKDQLLGVWTGNPRYNADELLRWAGSREINPADPDFTTLGSICRPLLSDVGLQDQRAIAAIVVVYKLFRRGTLLADLKKRYGVPELASQVVGDVPGIGPDIDWSGPARDLDLQQFAQGTPDLLDVGFLIRAMGSVASVCRVENSRGKKLGTGFLIAPSLILTTYHLLDRFPGASMDDKAQDIVLRFHCVTTTMGEESHGLTFRLATKKPVVASSPTSDLDYALLRVENSIADVESIKPACCEWRRLPTLGTGMYILQHPEGDTMKIALTSDGVTSVDEAKGLVQYWTKTAGGSSGSPCFNDDWKVVALHHAERSRPFGRIREGILFGAIYQEIERHLSSGSS